jgi:hypothetical protein
MTEKNKSVNPSTTVMVSNRHGVTMDANFLVNVLMKTEASCKSGSTVKAIHGHP